MKTMLQNTQSYSAIPLMFTCDEEGGRVNRLMSTLNTTMIGQMLDYKDQGVEIAYKNACTIASDMSALGFNADMAPVADVWSNPENTVIETGPTATISSRRPFWSPPRWRAFMRAEWRRH